MEKSKQIGPLASFSGIVSTFLHMGRFVEPLVRSKGIEVPNQIVLQVGNDGDAMALKEHFRTLGAAVDTPIKEVKCSQCYVTTVSANSKAKILRLLERKDLLLVFIVSGLVPSYLADCCVVQVDNRISNDETEFLAIESRNFIDYVCENPYILLQDLDNFKTSKWYIEHKLEPALNVSLHVILEAYHSYYRGRHCEADTEDWMEILEAGVEAIIDRTEGIGYDMMQPMRTVMDEYIENHPEIVFCDIRQVERQTVKALERDQAILFDDMWYFFPENLFRSICAPLLDIVALPEIKQRLLEDGFLDCDKGQTSGFTVKKQFVTAYGQRLRMRFLKVSRDFIVEDGSLTLEERG